MRADDALALLRAADPARALADVPADEREALRRSIVEREPQVTPRPRRARRVAIVAATATATAVALASASVAWGLHAGVFGTASQVRQDFATEAASIPLPPGVRLPAPSLDGSALYGGRAGEMLVFGRATCSWLAYWLDARSSGGGRTAAAATAGLVRLRALMPVHAEGAPEEVGGYDAASLGVIDAIVSDQRGGTRESSERYLRANCG